MFSSTRTVYGVALQAIQHAGLPFVLEQNTTLNERFGVLSGVTPPKTPSLAYFCIGKGGHQSTNGADGTPLTKSKTHKTTDAGLFSFLPFIIRPTSSDLSPVERAKYAMRVQQTFGGTNYFCYYLKRYDFSAATLTKRISTTTNGVTSYATFTPSAGNLQPTATVLSANGVNPLAGQAVEVSSTSDMSLSGSEVQEIINAATIIYGDPAYAVISEIGICSGVDKIIDLGGGVTFNEAIAVQICTFINTIHILSATPEGVAGTLQLGSSEPIYQILG
jgi:hypothetical protein